MGRASARIAAGICGHITTVTSDADDAFELGQQVHHVELGGLLDPEPAVRERPAGSSERSRPVGIAEQARDGRSQSGWIACRRLR